MLGGRRKASQKNFQRRSKVNGGIWANQSKGSPKPQPTVKSITWLLPSHHHSVINPDHVSLLRALLRNAGPLLSWAAKSPSCESRFASTTCRAEASTSSP